MRPRDYKVDYRSEEDIARIAADVRLKLDIEEIAKLDMVTVIKCLLGRQIGNKGKLQFDLYDYHPDKRPAEVRFNPLTLRVDRELWEHAKLGDPFSKFVLSHELGHILLHTAEAKAFTGKETDFSIYGFEGHSGEWQADTFGGHFLVPDHTVLQMQDPVQLASYCDVERNLAFDRINSAKRRKLIRPKITGDICAGCGGLLILAVRCSTCGKQN